MGNRWEVGGGPYESARSNAAGGEVDKATADAAGWRITDSTAFRIETLALDGALVDGLRDGLEGVRNQDECFILFSGKYGYGSHSRGTIPARSALVYHIWVNSISND